MSKLKQLIQIYRLRFICYIFPLSGLLFCANRVERRFETDKIKIVLSIKDKRKPGGYSEEEMLHFMDEYVGRKITAAEITFIQAMKDIK